MPSDRCAWFGCLVFAPSKPRQKRRSRFARSSASRHAHATRFRRRPHRARAPQRIAFDLARERRWISTRRVGRASVRARVDGGHGTVRGCPGSAQGTRARGMRCDVTRAWGVGVMVMSCALRCGGGDGVERAGERVRRARRGAL